MKDINYDKPFKTYEELISIMRSRNVIITDENFAMSTLSNLSYYTLVNGYKNIFPIEPETEKFTVPILFEELYTLLLIDTSFSSVIFKNILYIEKSLKSRISYLISEKYGVYTDISDTRNANPDDYLCRRNYSNSNGQKTNILLFIKDALNADRNNAMILHYKTTKNHIPPWIVTTNIPFGLAISWYNILKADDKTAICEQFIKSDRLSTEDKKAFLKKSFDLLREYRNGIAHGNRSFNAPARSILPKKQLLSLAPALVTSKEYNRGLGQKDLYAVIILLLLLLNDKYLIQNFLNDCNHIFAPYYKSKFADKTIFEVFGLPNDLYLRINKHRMK